MKWLHLLKYTCAQQNNFKTELFSSWWEGTAGAIALRSTMGYICEQNKTYSETALMFGVGSPKAIGEEYSDIKPNGRNPEI